MKKLFLTVALAAMFAGSAYAQHPAGSPEGGISAEMLETISKGYQGTASDKAIRNALAVTHKVLHQICTKITRAFNAYSARQIGI